MCPNKSRKEIFCVCRGVPRWRSRIESGDEGGGVPSSPVGWVGRSRSRTGVSLRLDRAFCQLNYAPVVGRRDGNPPPDEVGRSYIREQRLKAFYRLFYPTTPLPECGQVSFLMGGIHQAGMEQRSGFEPPLPAWKAGVLTVEH